MPFEALLRLHISPSLAIASSTLGLDLELFSMAVNALSFAVLLSLVILVRFTLLLCPDSVMLGHASFPQSASTFTCVGRRRRIKTTVAGRPGGGAAAELCRRRGRELRRRLQVRVPDLRGDGVDLEGRDGRRDQPGSRGRRRRRLHHPGPGPVGRAHGRRPRLLRARQRGHLQRPGALPAVAAVPDEPHLRRLRPAPRLVLQVRGGHRHWAPRHGHVRQGRVRRPAVARQRRAAVPALRRA